MTNEEIIGGLVRGEAGAATALLDRFESPLVRYFQVSLPEASAAEDAAQEVFLRLVREAREGRLGTVRSLEAYVFTVARRLAIDIARSWNRRPAMESLDVNVGEDDSISKHGQVPSRVPDPREAATRRERDAHVAAALRALDEETRQVVVLRHVEGLSSQEVATIMGISVGAVWTRLHRGLNELRRTLAVKQIDEAPAKRSVT